jgi:hypothetical protein
MKKLICAGIVCSCVCLLSMNGMAQVKQGKTRLLKTKHMMKGLVASNCGAIAEGLKTAPADDKAWEALAVNAALLNESGYLLMDDGRCPDADWANASKALREASAAVLAKVEAKDAAGAQEAFKGVTASCKACHTVHKK